MIVAGTAFNFVLCRYLVFRSSEQAESVVAYKDQEIVLDDRQRSDVRLAGREVDLDEANSSQLTETVSGHSSMKPRL